MIHGNDTSLSQGCKNKYEYKDSKFTVLSLIKMVKQKFDLPDLGKVDSCLFLGFAGGKGAWRWRSVRMGSSRISPGLDQVGLWPRPLVAKGGVAMALGKNGELKNFARP